MQVKSVGMHHMTEKSGRLLAESSLNDKPLAPEIGEAIPMHTGPCELAEGTPKPDACQKAWGPRGKGLRHLHSITDSATCWLCDSRKLSKPL